MNVPADGLKVPAVVFITEAAGAGADGTNGAAAVDGLNVGALTLG